MLWGRVSLVRNIQVHGADCDEESESDPDVYDVLSPSIEGKWAYET